MAEQLLLQVFTEGQVSACLPVPRTLELARTAMLETRRGGSALESSLGHVVACGWGSCTTRSRKD